MLVTSHYRSLLGGLGQEEQEEGMEVEEGQEGGQEVKSKEAQNILRAQCTALEALVNLGCLEEEEEWLEDEEDDSEDDDEDVEETVKAEVNPEFCAMVVAQGLVAKVLVLANKLPQEVEQELGASRGGRRLLAQHLVVRTRALLALASLTELLCEDDLGGLVALQHTWNSLSQLCGTHNMEQELLEASTSALRATTQKLCKLPPGGLEWWIENYYPSLPASGQQLFLPSDLEALVNLYSRYKYRIQYSRYNTCSPQLPGLLCAHLTGGQFGGGGWAGGGSLGGGG